MMPGPGFVYAPVAEGADAGFVWVLLDGYGVGKIPVVYGQTIERQKAEERSFWQKLFGGN
jgi:hypothetical protein